MSDLFGFRHYLSFQLKNRQTISRLRSGEIDAQCQAAAALTSTGSGHGSRILLGELKKCAKRPGGQDPQNDSLRTALISALVEIGGPSATLLGPAFRGHGADWEQLVAKEVYGQIFQKCVAGLRDPNHKVRVDATLDLDSLKDPRSVRPFIDALSDSNSNVRMNAAFALGRLGDLQAVPALMSIHHDSDEMVRFAVISSLGELGDKRALPVIKSALANDVMLIQVKAQEALGKLGGS